MLNPFALLNPSEAHSQVVGQSRQAGTGKLGHDDVPGALYYLGTLTWGLGWLPLAAAAGGVVAGVRRDWRRTVLLVAFPLVLFLFLSTQARFFGRWLLPAYPALCILAGYGVGGARAGGDDRAAAAGRDRDRRGRGPVRAGPGRQRPRRRRPGPGGHPRAGPGVAGVTHVPAGAGVVVEPFVPADWLSRPPLGDLHLRRYPVQRPFQGYEKRLRASRVERYRRGGFCWVVVGSHQKDRGLKAGLRNARDYYRALDAASATVVRFSPYARGADPVAVLLRQVLRLRAAGVRAPGPRGRDPPPARVRPARGLTGGAPLLSSPPTAGAPPPTCACP